MTAEDEKAEQVEALLATPDLANALESRRFRSFLDHIPIAIVVAEMREDERIVYANLAFEALSEQPAAAVEGKPWSALSGQGEDAAHDLGTAVAQAGDTVGSFRIQRTGSEPALVDVYANVIEDDAGSPSFRLVALVEARASERAEFEQRIRDKDVLLRELQHRVRNNLQMIVALIRIEARNAPDGAATAPFDRLAGRVEALRALYQSLSEAGQRGEIDLGVYLSQIAAAVMRANAVDGIRLDLKVDAYPVSVNVAIPAGLVVNELLTNALKHAFVGRDNGTITVHSLVEGDGCRVVVADNGVGLPEGVEWPQRGKLGALIVKSLRENAKARLTVATGPGQGVRVTILFSRAVAAPEAVG